MKGPNERAPVQREQGARPTSHPRGTLLLPEAGGSEELARARISFLVDEPVPSDVVRMPIFASWTRSREWHVPTDHVEVPYASNFDDDTPFARAAGYVLADAAESLAAEPVSLILCDAGGFVLDRRTGDDALERQLDRVSLAPGFSYAESEVGTNGIGTTLEGGGPVQVFGHEHYVEHLEDLACAGFPIHHPVTGRLLGVIDLTCWRRDAGRMMAATVATLARRIEESLFEQSGRRELALMHDYLAACQRKRGPVFALSDDLLMMNDQARALIDAGDQAPLLAEAADALAAGRHRRLVVDLPSGLTARVTCKPSISEAGAGGGVLQVQLSPTAGTGSRRAGAAVAAPPLPAAVGSGALWTKCCQEVARHFQAREWILLEGEAGTGKTTLARATQQRHSPAAHVRVLDAKDYGPEWIAEVIKELATGTGSLVLTHVDRLFPEGLQALGDALEPHRESTDPGRPWVVATVTRDGRDGGAETRYGRDDDADLAGLLACFPRTVRVPPLRHHVEDVAELVPHLHARLNRGASLTWPPEVMRVLMRNRWPGNVQQLYQVLRKIVAKRRSGAVELRDLPPECRATTRRMLTPLEAIECDAIVDALLDTDGNKARAARLLGMSRATIYRKVREYGISTPSDTPKHN